jgi:hypothetical protein
VEGGIFWQEDRDGAVLWDAVSGQELGRLRGVRLHVYPPRCGSPDGSHIAGFTDGVGFSSGLVRLWDGRTGEESCCFVPYDDGYLTLTPDGHYRMGGVERLALAGRDGALVPPDAAWRQNRWLSSRKTNGENAPSSSAEDSAAEEGRKKGP